jgi:hypothetical protein
MMTSKHAKEIIESLEEVTSIREATGNPNIIGWYLFWVSFNDGVETAVWVDQEGAVHIHE